MNDYERPPEEKTRASAVVGGLVLGLLLAFAYMIVAFFAAYAMDPQGDGSGVIWIVLWAAPAVVGVLLLLFPRSRRAGAGLVIGLAIGLIVLPGVCTLPVLGG